VGRPKIFGGINLGKTSSKDPIGLNIDYTEKSIFGCHLKNQSTIKKRMILRLCKLLTTFQLRVLQRIKDTRCDSRSNFRGAHLQGVFVIRNL